MTDVDALLKEAAAATAGADVPAPKKERVKKSLDAATAPKEPKAPKASKEPKAPKQYPQANEDGTPALNEDGSPVLGPKETAYKAPKAPRGPRGSNVYLDTQVIRRTAAAAEFKARPDSKRGQMFAAAEDGRTVGEFYAAQGGKSEAHTFLVWFINAAKVVELE